MLFSGVPRIHCAMADVDASWPVVEDPSSHTYIRPEGGGLMVGLFEPDAAAWKGTAVSALQAAARGANSLDGASTAALACVDLERRQLSTYVLGDSGWLLFAPSASGRRLCARSSPQLHRVGTPACPYGNARVAISSPGCSPKGVRGGGPVLMYRCLGHAGAP